VESNILRVQNRKNLTAMAILYYDLRWMEHVSPAPELRLLLNFDKIDYAGTLDIALVPIREVQDLVNLPVSGSNFSIDAIPYKISWFTDIPQHYVSQSFQLDTNSKLELNIELNE